MGVFREKTRGFFVWCLSAIMLHQNDARLLLRKRGQVKNTRKNDVCNSSPIVYDGHVPHVFREARRGTSANVPIATLVECERGCVPQRRQHWVEVRIRHHRLSKHAHRQHVQPDRLSEAVLCSVGRRGNLVRFPWRRVL